MADEHQRVSLIDVADAYRLGHVERSVLVDRASELAQAELPPGLAPGESNDFAIALAAGLQNGLDHDGGLLGPRGSFSDSFDTSPNRRPTRELEYIGQRVGALRRSLGNMPDVAAADAARQIAERLASVVRAERDEAVRDVLAQDANEAAVLYALTVLSIPVDDFVPLPSLYASLPGSASARSGAAVEPLTASLQRFLHDAGPELTDYDERVLRRELRILRDEHEPEVEVRPDRVMQSIGAIVEILHAAGLIEESARRLLESMDARPPEVVDQIVARLNELYDNLAEVWTGTDRSLDERGTDLVQASEAADEVFAELARVTPVSDSKFASYLDKYADGLLRGLGAGTAAGMSTVAYKIYQDPAMLSTMVTELARFASSVGGTGMVQLDLLQLLRQLPSLYLRPRYQP